MSEIGHNKKYIYSKGDEKGICPHCSSNDSSILGVLNKSINRTEQYGATGFEKDLVKCTKCNALYTNVSGAIKQLCEDYGTSFVSIQQSNQQIVVPHNTNVTNSYETQRKLEELNQIKNNTSSTTSAIYAMQSSLAELTRTVYELTQQNVKLMEKLVTDPMVSIRKVVSDFNLK